MRSKYISGAALALGAGLFVAPASAAPVGNLTGLQAPNTSNVDTVAYGRCWRHHGRLHCRRAFRRYGYADPYYYDPYPDYGYGYGPTVGFSFGGGRHGGHHHR
jgi:hypothetical protein